MSLGRLAYYSAILAGWGAFLTWALVEFTVYKQLSDSIGALVLSTCVGAGIGCGVNVAAGLGRGDAAGLPGAVPGAAAAGACDLASLPAGDPDCMKKGAQGPVPTRLFVNG